MFRRVVLSSPNSVSGGITLAYYVKSARFMGQARLIAGEFNASIPNAGVTCPVIFANGVKLATSAGIGKNIYYFFDFDVGENQPIEERVVEISSAGVAIAVYNANGVLVCDNGVADIPSSDPTQSEGVHNGPGEMTSVPIDGPGEMASEPIDGPGAMI